MSSERTSSSVALDALEATHSVGTGESRIAVAVRGSGPLVLCVPGMGDLKRVYRFLSADLVAAGYRVATMDLRGHGESGLGFDTFDDNATAADIVAVLKTLNRSDGVPAVVIGNSMAAGSAVLAATAHPGLVAATVLVGPFVRNPRASALATFAFRSMMLRPWGKTVWLGYWPSLYRAGHPAGFAEHKAAIKASLSRSGYWRAFAATTHTSHEPVDRVLDALSVPTLVVMGDQDPDFADPEAEAHLISDRTGATVVMVAGAGHYPQAESAATVSPAIREFLGTVPGFADPLGQDGIRG